MNKVKDGDFIDTNAFSWCEWPEEHKEKKRRLNPAVLFVAGLIIGCFITYGLMVLNTVHSTWIERRCPYERTEIHVDECSN